jgi:hypothetical protein
MSLVHLFKVTFGVSRRATFELTKIWTLVDS